MNKRTMLCSTGAMIGRSNGFDIHLITKNFPRFMADGLIEGGELMMLPVYYDRLAAVSGEWLAEGIPFPVIHCEKNVGTLLSDAATADAAGDTDTAKALRAQAEDDFRRNCEMGAMAHSSAMVLHLWGGFQSDAHIAYNVDALPALCEIIKPYGIRLLIENVPSNTHDPHSNWRRLIPQFAECDLIFDTRFGQLHRQIAETWADTDIAPHIRHIHISDILGAPRDFSTLRPILHPGEGMVDFDAFRRILDDHAYSGTITLESPVIREGGADEVKLAETLAKLKGTLGIE